MSSIKAIDLAMHLYIPFSQGKLAKGKFIAAGWLTGLASFGAAFALFFIFTSSQTLPEHEFNRQSPDQMFMVSKLRITLADGRPASNAIVTLDDRQQVQANSEGAAFLEDVMHGNHSLAIFASGQHYRQTLHIHGPLAAIKLEWSQESVQTGEVLFLGAFILWLGLGSITFLLKPVSFAFSNYLRVKPKLIHQAPRLLSWLVSVFVLISLLNPFFAESSHLAKAAPLFNDILPVPDNLNIEEDDHNAILTWNDGPLKPDQNEPEGVAGYRVSWGISGQSLDNVALTDYRILQLQPLLNGQRYEVRVQSVAKDGSLSPTSQTLNFTGTSARVDSMRSKMTGFFDDFNRPAGAPDELKWNSAYSYCNDPKYSAFFINSQYHVHSLVAATNCDRGQAVSRPRQIFDFTGRTGTITFDFDGAFRRDQWYLDLVPKYMDIGGQVNIEAGNTPSDPGKVLRFHQTEQKVEILYITEQGIETSLADSNSGNFSSLDWAGLKLVPNVRRHWEIKVSQSNAEILINGKTVLKAALELPFTKGYLLWNEFSYNTHKSNEPFVLGHWDNFGFDGPSSNIETHNYRTAGYGGSDYKELDGNSASYILNIPDRLEGNIGRRLMFTLQMNKGWYKYDPSDSVEINGQTLPIPQPSGAVQSQSTLVNVISPYSTVILLPEGVLKNGSNNLKFSCKSCGVTNIHAEFDFRAGKAPAYTPPEKINPVIEVPSLPEVGPGASIETFNGKVVGEVGNEVHSLEGVVAVFFKVQNQVAMNATGKNPGIQKVQLRLNQVPIFEQNLNNAPSFDGVYQFDSTRYANGQYELDVYALNPEGTPSIPDYFQAETLTGDYKPVQIKINNPVSGQISLPLLPPPAAQNRANSTVKIAPTGKEVQPIPAGYSGKIIGIGKGLYSLLVKTLPLTAGGVLALAIYLAVGAWVGNKIRKKRKLEKTKLRFIVAWPLFSFGSRGELK